MDSVYFQLTCKRCGHKWLPMDGPPVVCPRCKSYKWNEPKKKHEQRKRR